MNEKNKKILFGIFITVVIVVVVVWFMKTRIDHIEDTNGENDYSLTTITDQQIIDRSMGSLNVQIQTGLFDGMVTISSNKFSGIYEVFEISYLSTFDFSLQLYEFSVSSGNFKMCVIYEDEIIAVLSPNDLVEYSFTGKGGSISLVIAGESSEFSFKMTEFDYDNFM